MNDLTNLKLYFTDYDQISDSNYNNLLPVIGSIDPQSDNSSQSFGLVNLQLNDSYQSDPLPRLSFSYRQQSSFGFNTYLFDDPLSGVDTYLSQIISLSQMISLSQATSFAYDERNEHLDELITNIQQGIGIIRSAISIVSQTRFHPQKSKSHIHYPNKEIRRKLKTKLNTNIIRRTNNLNKNNKKCHHLNNYKNSGHK